MRIEGNSGLEKHYLVSNQEVRPAKTLLEVQQAKAAWETTDRFEPSVDVSDTIESSKKHSEAESTALSSLGLEDKESSVSQTDKQKLIQGEAQVRAHEAAHKAAAGKYAGPIIYNYAVGPDGKRYIVGGEVSIHAPEGSTPEETIRIMEQVKNAALAPGDPSPQDLAVAAQASIKIMQARQEMAREEIKGDKSTAVKESLPTEASSPGTGRISSEDAEVGSIQSTPAALHDEDVATQKAKEEQIISQDFTKKKILEYQQLLQWMQPGKSKDKGAALDLIA